MPIAAAASGAAQNGSAYPQHSASTAGSSNFIPTVFSGKMLERFYPTTVFGEIANTDYIGEISKVGDKVIVRTTPDVAVSDYSKGGKIVYSDLDSDPIELTIDYAKAMAFKLDDIDDLQSDLKLMTDWTQSAAESMKQVIDKHVLGAIYSGAAAANKGATAGAITAGYNLGAAGAPLAVTTANVLDTILDAGAVLDEQNIPDTDRFIILPSWMGRYLKSSDLKNTSITGDASSPVRNGKIGDLDRFTVYLSNNILPVTDGSNKGYHVVAGHKSALAFATQLTKTEHIRLQDTFADALRSLMVYGFKVVQQTALVDLYVRKA